MKPIKYLLLLLLICVLGYHFYYDNPSRAFTTVNEAPFQEATVQKIVDGDTIYVVINDSKYKLRFILVDTPEYTNQKEYFGKEATAYAISILPIGAKVWLEKDVSETDRYGRLLRYVWLKCPTEEFGEAEVRKWNVSALLIANGYGQLATYPPDVKYIKLFRMLQTQARDNGIGLWAESVVLLGT